VSLPSIEDEIEYEHLAAKIGHVPAKQWYSDVSRVLFLKVNSIFKRIFSVIKIMSVNYSSRMSLMTKVR